MILPQNTVRHLVLEAIFPTAFVQKGLGLHLVVYAFKPACDIIKLDETQIIDWQLSQEASAQNQFSPIFIGFKQRCPSRLKSMELIRWLQVKLKLSKYYIQKVQKLAEMEIEKEHSIENNLQERQKSRSPKLVQIRQDETSSIKKDRLSIIDKFNQAFIQNQYQAKHKRESISSNIKIRRRARQLPKIKYQQCPVCFSECTSQTFRTFGHCNHLICTKCLDEHISFNLKSFKVVQCPIEDCPQKLEIQSPHIRSLPITQQQKYYKISVVANLANNPELKLCPRQNCQGFIIISQDPVFCPICQFIFCKKCLMVIHKGDCDANGVQFMENKYHFRRCNQCKMVVQKNEGCNHMTCKCKYQFCYLCGGKWGPNHKCKKIIPPIPPLPSIRPPQIMYPPEGPIRQNANAEPLPQQSNISSSVKLGLIYFTTFLVSLLTLQFLWAFLVLLLVLLSPLLVAIVIFSFAIVIGIHQAYRNYSWQALLLGNIFLVFFCIIKEFWKCIKQQFSIAVFAMPLRSSIFPISTRVVQKMRVCMGVRN